MPKTIVDLSWQADYAREYERTTGKTMAFSPVKPGGMYTVTTTDSAGEHCASWMRRAEAIANSARLKERPDFVEPALDATVHG